MSVTAAPGSGPPAGLTGTAHIGKRGCLRFREPKNRRKLPVVMGRKPDGVSSLGGASTVGRVQGSAEVPPPCPARGTTAWPHPSPFQGAVTLLGKRLDGAASRGKRRAELTARSHRPDKQAWRREPHASLALREGRPGQLRALFGATPAPRRRPAAPCCNRSCSSSAIERPARSMFSSVGRLQ